MGTDEERDGVPLTNLDQPLFDGAEATKRDLVDYLDAVTDRLIPHLRDRPLSVIRVRPGQPPFMQKNVPKYTPDWVPTIALWAEASKRDVSYALATTAGRCCGSPTSGPSSTTRRSSRPMTGSTRPTSSSTSTRRRASCRGFALAVQAALLVAPALADTGMAGAVKTSGAKGVHVFVPLTAGADGRRRRGDPGDCGPRRAARPASSRPRRSSARTGTARSSSTRPGPAGPRWSPPTARGSAPGPVSFPVPWTDLDRGDAGRLHHPLRARPARRRATAGPS